MPRLLVRKLLRDLRGTWGRILTMILAMSTTLIVLSGILYTRGIVAREMPRAYLGTSPASATLLLERGLAADQLAAITAAIRARPGIIAVAPRTHYTLQVQDRGGGWGPNPLQIFVAFPDDAMQIETVAVEQGIWPPAPGEILLDRSSFALLDVKVGDVVVVQAPNGTPTPLRISGSVYDPALAPSFQEQKGHAFLSAASLPSLGEPLTLDALKIQVADQPDGTVPTRDRDVIVASSRALADWLERTYGIAVREIQAPTPYAHPHQAQADSLLLGLLIFGGAGLILSAILVATMLNGLMTQHIPQIGIMKAIGAQSSQVLRFYLLMTLLIGGSATVLAIIPGILMSRVVTPAILTLLGIDAERLTPPGWMYGAVVLAGVGVPLLFSLASLITISRTTVRQALDYRGVAQRASVLTRFDAMLSRLGGRNRMLLMAFRTIFRRRARLLLSVGLLASAGAVFVAGMSTMAGFRAFLDREQAARRWDVDVRMASTDSGAPAAATLAVVDIPGVAHVEGWTMLQTSIVPPGQRVSVTRTYPDTGHGSIAVTVVPTTTLLLDPPALRDGRWLRPGDTSVVVMTERVRTTDLPAVRVGDAIQLSLGGRLTTWQVVGVVEAVAGHGGGLFTTEAGFVAATGLRQPNLLRIVTDSHDEAARTTVAQAAERRLTDAGIIVQSAASVGRMDAASAGHMLPLIVVFLGLAIAMGVVGFAGLASTMSTSIVERIREFGVMSAIGAPAAMIYRLVVLEGLSVALVSCVAAVLPALLLTRVMMAALPMTGIFQVSWAGVMIWGVVVIVGTILATLAPATRAARLTVREALAAL
jgi:putative ABC transport system permease protein